MFHSRKQVEAVHYAHAMKNTPVKINAHQDPQGLNPKRWAATAAVHSAVPDGLSPSGTQLRRS